MCGGEATLLFDCVFTTAASICWNIDRDFFEMPADGKFSFTRLVKNNKWTMNIIIPRWQLLIIREEEGGRRSSDVFLFLPFL